MLTTLTARCSVHVQHDVESVLFGPADGFLEPIHPTGFIQEAGEEWEADVVHAEVVDSLEIGRLDPLVSPCGSDSDHGIVAESFFDGVPERSVIFDFRESLALGSFPHDGGHPDFFHKPAAEIDASEGNHATRRVYEILPFDLEGRHGSLS